MADDAMAAIYANLSLRLVLWLLPAWIRERCLARARDGGSHRGRQRDCSDRRASTRTRCSLPIAWRRSASSSARRRVVGDDRRRLSDVFRASLTRADLVVLTGGLGPTDDDLTREVVAEVLGLELREDAAHRRAHPGALRAARAADAGRQPPSGDGAARCDGRSTTRTGPRPGFSSKHDGHVDRAAAGPAARAAADVRRRLRTACSARAPARTASTRRRCSWPAAASRTSRKSRSRSTRGGRAEDAADRDDDSRDAGPGGAASQPARRSRTPRQRSGFAAAHEALRVALGPDVFSTDGRSMEDVVGALLRERGLTIAAAESCTGGLLLSRLTDVAGQLRLRGRRRRSSTATS